MGRQRLIGTRLPRRRRYPLRPVRTPNVCQFWAGLPCDLAWGEDKGDSCGWAQSMAATTEAELIEPPSRMRRREAKHGQRHISSSFSRQVWHNMLSVLGASTSQVGADTILDWWTSWRYRWNGDKRRGTDSLFALAAWELWKEQNTRCFHDALSTVQQVLVTIKSVANLWIDAGASKIGCLVRE